MANQYLDYPLVADARDLMQKCFDYLATKFTGWLPSEGQLDTAIIEAVSSEAADIASLTTEVPKSIFRYFGAKLMGIDPIDAVAATCTSTWTLTNTNGHIIPSGTQVSIPDSEGNPVPFVTLNDVTVAAGNSVTGTGEVVLIAVVPGADSTGVGSVNGSVTLVDIYDWVSSINQETVSTGGVDAEDDDTYLSRLSQELMTISPRPILPEDFGILARNADAGIQRATAIDGYNTADQTYNNERMVTVVALDSTGAGVSAGIKTEIATYLGTLRELNFVVNTDDPTVTNVDVTAVVVMESGYSQSDVQTRVTAAINAYLDPTTWGIDPTDDPNDPITWNNSITIRYLELAAAIDNVSGVAYITTLTIGLSGGAQTAADHDMTGAAPIPNAGTISVTAS